MSIKHRNWQGHQVLRVGFSTGSQSPGHQVGVWEEIACVCSRDRLRQSLASRGHIEALRLVWRDIWKARWLKGMD